MRIGKFEIETGAIGGPTLSGTIRHDPSAVWIEFADGREVVIGINETGAPVVTCRRSANDPEPFATIAL